MSHSTPSTPPSLDDLRRHIGAAAVPALILLTAQVTGDLGLLRDAWRPVPAALPHSGLPPEVDAEVVAVCLDRLTQAIEEGREWDERLSPEFLSAVGEWALGSTSAELTDLLRAAYVAEGTDPGAPSWKQSEVAPEREFRAAVIGSGIAGLMIGLRLKQAGVDFTIYEKSMNIGGTWWENTYPDCRTDVHSHIYAYSFQPHDWPSYFCRQGVILDYLTEFAKTHGLLEHIQFDTEVKDAHWDESRRVWETTLVRGDETSTASANILVSAVGQLNRPSIPQIPGLEDFDGPAFHSAGWDHGIDFAGKRVAVIGTGASALQFVPAIAREGADVTVYQRSAPWLMPTPELRQDIGDDERWLLNELPLYRALYRFTIFVPRAIGQLDAATVDPDYPPSEFAVSAANEELRKLLTAYLVAQAGDREDLVDKIVPDYPVGAKRIIRDDGTWVATLKRDNVELVTDAVSRIVPTGVVTADGRERPADVIIFGTGFRAADFLTPMEVTGEGGKDLHETWGIDACAYMGITVPDFPNLFCMYGPNTGLVLHGNVVFFMECQANYVMKAIEHLLREDAGSLSLTHAAFDRYREQITAASATRVWEWSSTHSWYQNAAGRSTIMWPLPAWDYVKATADIDPAQYHTA